MRHLRRHRFGCLVPVAILICFCCSQGTLLGANIHLSWSPNSESDLAGYKVYYGTASRSYATSIDIGNQTAYTIPGLKVGIYYLAVTAYDRSGNESRFSKEATVTISLDTTPPQISSVRATSISATGATVSWTTNEASDTQVEYGPTTAYGSSSSLVSALVTRHLVSLLGLQASQLYHYRVKSRDAAGNLANSADFTFTTNGDTTPPTISAVGASSITASSATIHWITNEPSDTQVEYGPTTAYGSSSSLVSALVTRHLVSLLGLRASQLYHYRVKSRDAAGNRANSADFTFTTSAASGGPKISNVGADSITASGASVHWTTDKASDTQVDYGTTTAYGSTTPRVSTMVISHTGLLSGLRASQLYHYRVKSRDSGGNLATSTDFSFTTRKDSTAPVISGVGANSITASAATIRWTTNEASDTQVEYGLTSAYGSSTSRNASRVTAHSQALPGLTPGKLYHYRVKSRDAAGNLAVSGDFRFNTAAASDTPPVFSRVGASWIIATGALINWTTDKPRDGQIEFGTSTTYGRSSRRVTSLTLAHAVELPGLRASTRYHYRIKGRDAGGNLKTSGDCIFSTAAPDRTPPGISGVTVSFITGHEATISWATNEASDSQVRYGLTTVYGSQSGLSTSLMVKHSQVLRGLSPDRIYHYCVKSRDASGNLAVSTDFKFRTVKPGKVSPDILTFDSPAPRGSSNDFLNGLLGGINFGSGQWRWERSYSVNTTKHVYFDSAKGTSRAFTFAPAPKVLNSVSVFSMSPGILTLSDNLGQRKSLSVPAGSGQVVTTGWSRGSRTVTVTFSSGWNLGLDDITFSDLRDATSLSTAPADDSGFVISGVTLPPPDIVGQPASPSSDTIFIPSVVDDSHFRTNLGISNLSNSVANVKLTLVSKEGNVLGTRVVTVNPLGLEQINSVARVLLFNPLHAGIQGSLILESDQEISAWVAQINNFNNDPSFLQGRRKGSSKILIPSAANLSSFSSSLAVMNVGSTAAEISVRSYNPSGEVMGQTQAPISLSPRGSIVFENVLAALGVKDNFGPIEITSLNGVPLLATSRVSGTKQSAGFFEGLDYSDASTLQIIPSVVENANERTNIGINNVSDHAASVRVRLKSGDGSELGTLRIVVPAKGLSQLNHAARQLIGPEIAADVEGYVELQSDQPIVAWASQINNATNDPAFDVGQAHGSSRLLLRATNGRNFRSNLVVVNIGDADAIVNIVSRDEDGEIQGQLTGIPIPVRGYFNSTNILENLGITQGSGTVEIISANGQPVIATSRVYSNSRMSGFLKAIELD